jgi:transcriptional regulator with XRE-family HTH domain
MVYPVTGIEGNPVMVKMDPVTFSKRLRESRLAADLTQLQVAEACGLTKGAVSAWEKGVTDGILAENLFCVADVLGVDPRWLATGQASTAAVGADLAKGLADLPADQQEAVRALIRSLKR